MNNSNNIKNQYEDIELGNLLFGHSRGNFSIDRDKYQDIFVERLEKLGFDMYGYCDDSLKKYENSRGGVTTDLFEVNPYWWGDDDNYDEIEKPNFAYKPLNLEINWYKYPMRDSYSNIPLDSIDIDKMFDDIENHLKLLNKVQNIEFPESGSDGIDKDENSNEPEAL